MLRLAGALAGALVTYSKIAWWGIVSPRREKEPLVVLQAVIRRDESVLLSVRSDLQGWELPGGTLEAGEGFEQALTREVREETGLDVEVLRFTGEYVRTGFRPHTARVYECRCVGGLLKPSHESLALSWFAIDALPEALFPWYRGPLEDAFAGSDEPVRRVERQGVREIAAGMRIDLRMRVSGGKG